MINPEHSEPGSPATLLRPFCLVAACAGVPSIACCCPWFCTVSPSPSKVWGWDELWGHGVGTRILCCLTRASLSWESLSCIAEQGKCSTWSKEAKRNRETYREPLFQRVCIHDNGSGVGL